MVVLRKESKRAKTDGNDKPKTQPNEESSAVSEWLSSGRWSKYSGIATCHSLLLRVTH